MNKRNSLYRKLGYAAAMAGLLVPLSLLSPPRTVDQQQRVSPGGVLAKLRNEYDLGQSDLGEVDPASETMKLATLGLKAVAVNLLSHQANEFKKKENWTKLTATLDQLARLQPNFITFWKYQAWNQSYNLSVEFDDYRRRYYYVRRGIEFLEEGERYNRDNPQLLWELGWFVGQKIGRADEKKQYRRLFKSDEDFHGDRPTDRRDNWLVSKEWYGESVVAADDLGKGIGRKSPLVFYSSGPKSQMNYAEAIEDEGRFETAEAAWARGETEWVDQLGNREVEHSTGVTIRLADEAIVADRLAEARARLDAIAPESSAKLLAERRAELTDEQREAMDAAADQRTEQQVQQAFVAQSKLRVKPSQLAEQIARDRPDRAREAERAAEEVERLEGLLDKTQAYKRTSNYDYWLLRCRFEQTADAIEARKAVFLGGKAFTEDLDPVKAKALYERGMASWRRVTDAFPEALNPEHTTGEDILEHIVEYKRVLDQLEEELPEDFPLWDVIEEFDTERELADELAAHLERQASAGEGGPDSAGGAGP